jgi:uncharacterized protein YbjQ (UPF0145 family)
MAPQSSSSRHMELLFQFGFFLTLLVIGLLFGTLAERRHLRKLAVEEAALRSVMVFNERHVPAGMEVRHARLVMGSVVIGEDYFKRIAAGLKSIFGGQLGVYESLMDRGRREAIVRMKREAQQLGASMVFNVRFETSSLSEDSSGRRAAFSSEFIAYGTALVAKLPV